MSLRRRHDTERSLHLEEPSDMADRSYLARVGDQAVQPVPDKGVGIDARPQRFADRDEFLHPVGALAVVDQFIVAVILIVGAPLGRDDVEGNAPACDVVERVQKTRDIEWVHERRCVGQPEADMARDPRHRCDPRAHIEPRPRHAPTHGCIDAALPGVGNAAAVAEKAMSHADILSDTSLASDPVSVTMPGCGVVELGANFVRRSDAWSSSNYGYSGRVGSTART